MLLHRLCDSNTKIYDYGDNSVYPGFLEAHCHPVYAGYKMFSVAKMTEENTLEECVQVIKEYIEANPQKMSSMESGFQLAGKFRMPVCWMLSALIRLYSAKAVTGILCGSIQSPWKHMGLTGML
ncbi:MAG: hypothetical protein K6C05_05225 [Anaerovibrio sp.]|uniref:hypothetical protein n=1 Tax=Anaerovibrio sp. TaxID=1872532 RepID=UPI0025E16864|nr:hypothetical protein [Anaerovibrio sp.]MCR5176233.1 hypothetical protein [Anaerovibrio sp.]